MGDHQQRLDGVIRCPKCENLLPELPEFSVIGVGGCGAVLREGTGKANPPTSDDSGVESFEKADSEGRDSSQRRRERESGAKRYKSLSTSETKSTIMGEFQEPYGL